MSEITSVSSVKDCLQNPPSSQEPSKTLVVHLTPSPEGMPSEKITKSVVPIPTDQVIAAARKKKKKKKKPNGQPNTSVSEKSIPHSQLIAQPAPPQKKYSLCKIANLTKEEQDIVKKMVQQWPLTDKLCWLDLFIATITTDYSTLINSLPKGVVNISEWMLFRDRLCTCLLMSFAHFIGAGIEGDGSPELREALSSEKFFRDKKGTIKDIEDHIGLLKTLERSLRSGPSRKLKAICSKAVQNAGVVIEKLNLLHKIYTSDEYTEVLAGEALSSYEEAQEIVDSEGNGPFPAAAIVAFMQSIEECLAAGRRCGVMGVEQNSLGDLKTTISEVANNGINEQTIDRLNTCFAGCAVEFGNLDISLKCMLLNACKGTYTYVDFCQEQGSSPTGERSKEDFTAQLFFQYLVATLINCWINNSFEAVHDNCALKHVNIPKNKTLIGPGIVRHLVNSLTALKKENVSKTTDVKATFSIHAFQRKISERLTASKRFQEALTYIRENDLTAEIGECTNMPFILSTYQRCLSPLLKHRSSQSICDSLGLANLHKELLQVIEKAKPEILLAKTNPAEVKELLLKIVWNHLKQLFLLLSCLHDAEILCLGKGTKKDVFPKELVSLLYLDGFDEIFPERQEQIVQIQETEESFPVPEARVETEESFPVPETRVEIEESVPIPKKIEERSNVVDAAATTFNAVKNSSLPLSVPKSSQQRELPSKQEFMKMKPRKIEHLLDRLLFENGSGETEKRSGKGSHLVYHLLQGTMLLSQNKREKRGTKSALFDQVLKIVNPKARFENKED